MQGVYGIRCTDESESVRNCVRESKEEKHQKNNDYYDQKDKFCYKFKSGYIIFFFFGGGEESQYIKLCNENKDTLCRLLNPKVKVILST